MSTLTIQLGDIFNEWSCETAVLPPGARVSTLVDTQTVRSAEKPSQDSSTVRTAHNAGARFQIGETRTCATRSQSSLGRSRWFTLCATCFASAETST